MNSNDDVERLLQALAEKYRVNLDRLPKKVRRMMRELAEGSLDAKRLEVLMTTQ